MVARLVLIAALLAVVAACGPARESGRNAGGTPVVVTDVGNNREIIEATGGGVVVSNIGDIAALQTGVGEMLTKTRDPEHMRAAFFSRFHIRDVSARRLQAILPDPARNA